MNLNELKRRRNSFVQVHTQRQCNALEKECEIAYCIWYGFSCKRHSNIVFTYDKNVEHKQRIQMKQGI